MAAPSKLGFSSSMNRQSAFSASVLLASHISVRVIPIWAMPTAVLVPTSSLLAFLLDFFPTRVVPVLLGVAGRELRHSLCWRTD